MNYPSISVIIPFYQRESGVLARSLASISAQGYPSDRLNVVVVDDGSPCPADRELVAHPPPSGLRITVIRQANAGPNEARNTGLAAIQGQTELIAYLDSDDEWIGDHLRRAIKALAAGYDAYFANLFHLGDTVDEFQKARRVQPEEHPMVAGDPTLRAYQGDMVHQIATANIIFMPTLVIRAQQLANARFPMGHRHGGGDYLYWIELIRHGARFVFSTEPEVRCGAGINMWYSSGWGTDGLAMRLVDEARFRRKVLEQHAKSDATKASLRNRLSELQVGMVFDVMHRIRHRKSVQWTAVRMLFRENPIDLGLLRHMLRGLIPKLGKFWN